MLGKLTICKPNELETSERDRWVKAQHATPIWNSPFLHPDFALHVAKYRPDTRIFIAEDQQQNRAWFAFHQLQGGMARPVGAPISDHQAVVMEPGFAADLLAVFTKAGIGAMPFGAWSEAKPMLGKFYTGSQNSHLLDLSQGPEAYFAAQQQQHRKYFKKMRQRARGVVREHGVVEIVTGVKDDELLDILFAWKHDQYKRTGKLDVLHIAWIRDLLEDLYASAHPDFRAILFGYKIGGKWAAAELGLWANGIFHSWIAAYDPQFSRVSPGLLLLHGIIEQAADTGIQQIDLGRGHDHYKKYYASSLLPLHTGYLVQSGPVAKKRKMVSAICDGCARLPLGKLGRLPARLDGSLEYIAACHPKRSDQFRAVGGGLLRRLKAKT